MYKNKLSLTIDIRGRNVSNLPKKGRGGEGGGVTN